jgi:hypothetical protein
MEIQKLKNRVFSGKRFDKYLYDESEEYDKPSFNYGYPWAMVYFAVDTETIIAYGVERANQSPFGLLKKVKTNYFSIDFNYSDTLNGFGLSGVQNTFIAKFSPNGDLIWDRRFEVGAYLPEYDYDYTNFFINDIAFNDDNSMILCGTTTGQIDTYLNTVFNQNVINNRNTVFYQKLK